MAKLFKLGTAILAIVLCCGLAPDLSRNPSEDSAAIRDVQSSSQIIRDDYITTSGVKRFAGEPGAAIFFRWQDSRSLSSRDHQASCQKCFRATRRNGARLTYTSWSLGSSPAEYLQALVKSMTRQSLTQRFRNCCGTPIGRMQAGFD
jgi:hypothetical protein